MIRILMKVVITDQS